MTNKRIKTGVRLRDVATAAGVSSATVSAIVNGRAQQYGICQSTQEKVQALIRQMGYSPSLAALDMAAGRNSLLGLAVSTDFPAADRLMASLEPALAQSGFRLVVAYLPSDPQVASARITSLLQFGIAGLVVCPPESLSLPKITCPAVIVGRPGAGLPAVYEDEAEGGRRLARRLLEKGHRRLAILGAPGSMLSATSGFLEACAQGGATTRCFNSVAEFLPVSGSVTAVFCGSSSVVLELYSRGLSAGLRLGSSLAVVAVDRLGVAAHLVPRPTVLKSGGTQLGQAAARLIQQAIGGAVPGDIRLEPVLVDGDSMPEISPDKAKPQSGISMEGGAAACGEPVEPSPPAPEPANPVFDVPAAVTTGDTPVTTGASLPLPVVAAVSTGGTGPESASPVAETEVTQALVSDEEINPHPNPLPSQGEGVSLPQDAAISRSEALQMPEAASDILSAPNSSLPASPPISMEGGAPSPPAPKPANPVFDVPAAVTTGETPVTTGASLPLPVVAAVPGGTGPESATPVTETEVTQALVSDEEINPHPNPLPSQGEGVRSPQDAAISPSEALQMPEAASDVPTEKVDN